MMPYITFEGRETQSKNNRKAIHVCIYIYKWITGRGNIPRLRYTRRCTVTVLRRTVWWTCCGTKHREGRGCHKVGTEGEGKRSNEVGNKRGEEEQWSRRRLEKWNNSLVICLIIYIKTSAWSQMQKYQSSKTEH